MKVQRILPVLLFLLLLAAFVFPAEAQCAMCKVSAKDSQYARKLNTGILYLLFAPVVILGSVMLYWLKNKDKFSGNTDSNHV